MQGGFFNPKTLLGFLDPGGVLGVIIFEMCLIIRFYDQ